jgi:nucleotide-binding universal stress UspA family protein
MTTTSAEVAPRRRPAAGEVPASISPNPVAIKTILVPLDFSRASMQSVSYAVSLAKKFSAAIHLVHVEAPDEACSVAGAGQVMRQCAESVAALHERLAGVQQKHLRAFWPENSHVRSGRPYQEICALAREIPADLIVLATRGHTGLKRVLLGSTTERVVRFAPCPVLIVRQRKRKGRDFSVDLVTSNEELTLRKILVPVDFSECGMTGAMYAALLAKTFDAKLHLFHAVRPPVPVILDRVTANMSGQDKVSLANAREEMEAFSKLDFLCDVKFETEIRTGHAVDEICAAANGPAIDLLVTSTHGRTGLNHALLGSVAEQVVRYAEAPVMVVPSRCATS